MIRLCADIFLFLFALSGSSFLFVPLMLACLFWFDCHYESVIAGAVVDVLYGAPLSFVHNIYLFGLTAAAVFLISEVLKKRLRYYSG